MTRSIVFQVYPGFNYHTLRECAFLCNYMIDLFWGFFVIVLFHNCDAFFRNKIGPLSPKSLALAIVEKSRIATETADTRVLLQYFYPHFGDTKTFWQNLPLVEHFVTNIWSFYFFFFVYAQVGRKKCEMLRRMFITTLYFHLLLSTNRLVTVFT